MSLTNVYEMNRARAALLYVDSKLSELLEYARYSCLDDFIPDIEAAQLNMRRLAETPQHLILQTSATRQLVILDPEGG